MISAKQVAEVVPAHNSNRSPGRRQTRGNLWEQGSMAGGYAAIIRNGQSAWCPTRCGKHRSGLVGDSISAQEGGDDCEQGRVGMYDVWAGVYTRNLARSHGNAGCAVWQSVIFGNGWVRESLASERCELQSCFTCRMFKER